MFHNSLHCLFNHPPAQTAWGDDRQRHLLLVQRVERWITPPRAERWRGLTKTAAVRKSTTFKTLHDHSRRTRRLLHYTACAASLLPRQSRKKKRSRFFFSYARKLPWVGFTTTHWVAQPTINLAKKARPTMGRGWAYELTRKKQYGVRHYVMQIWRSQLRGIAAEIIFLSWNPMSNVVARQIWFVGVLLLGIQVHCGEAYPRNIFFTYKLPCMMLLFPMVGFLESSLEWEWTRCAQKP